MLREIVEFVILTVLIVAVAKYLLYMPAKRIAERLKFSEQGAGQMLGYLTSAPELVAAVAVAATGFMTTVAFNILSSNVINAILALSAAAWYRQTRRLFTRQLWREHLIIVISIIVPILLLVTGQVESAWVIPVFLVAYVVYVLVIRRITADGAAPIEHVGSDPPQDAAAVSTEVRTGVRGYVALQGLLILAALASLYFLGTALGDTVYELGTTFGVPEAILGVVIGVVTSLPEWTTFFSSYAWHRRNGTDRASEEVTHNLLASNASNLLLVQTIALAVFLLVAT